MDSGRRCDDEPDGSWYNPPQHGATSRRLIAVAVDGVLSNATPGSASR